VIIFEYKESEAKNTVKKTVAKMDEEGWKIFPKSSIEK
jgi:hypothetical protein